MTASASCNTDFVPTHRSRWNQQLIRLSLWSTIPFKEPGEKSSGDRGRCESQCCLPSIYSKRQRWLLASQWYISYPPSYRLYKRKKKKKKRRGKLKNKGQQRFIDPSPRIQTDDEVGVSDNRTGGQSSSSCTIRGPRYDINSNTTLLSSTGCCLVLI